MVWRRLVAEIYGSAIKITDLFDKQKHVISRQQIHQDITMAMAVCHVPRTYIFDIISLNEIPSDIPDV